MVLVREISSVSGYWDVLLNPHDYLEVVPLPSTNQSESVKIHVSGQSRNKHYLSLVGIKNISFWYNVSYNEYRNLYSIKF